MPVQADREKHNNLGRQLEQARKSLGLSLRQAQEKSGVSNGYISQIERGDVEPSTEVLKRLSDAYGVPFSVLMEAAGYLVKRDEPVTEHKVPAFVFSAAERMDENDWRAAQAFFTFLLSEKEESKGPLESKGKKRK
jgi:transcriptional regulator with XRE-family HTH domain